MPNSKIASPPPDEDPKFVFRIGGDNPDPETAKSFIMERSLERDERLWFVYAIAKHETNGRVKVESGSRYYNQFYTGFQPKPIGDRSTDMGWAGWAKSWPLYNLDRGRRADGSRFQNGPGGYGIFQVTGDSKSASAIVPRGILWNWQDNVRAGIEIISTKIAFVDSRLPALQNTYTSLGPIPKFPLDSSNGRKRLSAWDSFVCTAYNGFGGCPQRRISGYAKLQYTCWDPAPGIWTFSHNTNRYCSSIFSLIEESE